MNNVKDTNLCTNREVPSELRLNCDLYNQAQYIESNIIDPVVSSPNFVRFIIPNSSFLSPNSILKIELEMSEVFVDSGVTNSFLPSNIGVFSLLDRIELKSNNKTIFSCNEENYYQIFKQFFINSSRNYNVKSIENGIYDGVFENVDTNVTENQQNNLMIKSMFAYDNDEDTFYADDFLRLVNGLEYQIKLSDLLPIFRRMLPMYLMKEEVSIELYFNSKNSYFNGKDSANTTNVSINPNEIKLVVDTVLYSEEVMDNFAKNNKLITFNNDSYFNWSRNFIQDAASLSFAGGQYQLGARSKFVTGVVLFWTDNENVAGYDKHKKLYSSYVANSPQSQNSFNEYNLLINGENIYPISVNNMAHQFTELGKFDYFTQPQVNRNQFLNDNSQYIDGSYFETKSLNAVLNFTKSAIYIPVNRMVNNDGVVLSMRRHEYAETTESNQILKAFVLVKEQISIDTERGEMYQRYITM